VAVAGMCGRHRHPIYVASTRFHYKHLFRYDDDGWAATNSPGSTTWRAAPPRGRACAAAGAPCARRAWPRPSLRPKTSKLKRQKKAKKQKSLKAKSKLTASQKQKQQKKPEGKEQAHCRQFSYCLR